MIWGVAHMIWRVAHMIWDLDHMIWGLVLLTSYIIHFPCCKVILIRPKLDWTCSICSTSWLEFAVPWYRTWDGIKACAVCKKMSPLLHKFGFISFHFCLFCLFVLLSSGCLPLAANPFQTHHVCPTKTFHQCLLILIIPNIWWAQKDFFNHLCFWHLAIVYFSFYYYCYSYLSIHF